MFGYKHERSMKFYGQLLRCLSDCCEGRTKRLKVNMNKFQNLKNELSMHFMRQKDNIVATLKMAIRVYVKECERDMLPLERTHIVGLEERELRNIEYILKNEREVLEDFDEEKKLNERTEGNRALPPFADEAAAEKFQFDKIVDKLVKYHR